MAALTGTTPAATYPSLIKFDDNLPISAALRVLSDGGGTDLPIEVSTTQVNFTADITANSANLVYLKSSGNFGVGLGGYPATARLLTSGPGQTSATSNFHAQNSNNSKSMDFNDFGNLVINGQVRIGDTAAPTASTILDLNTTTTKAVLFPKMTTTQKNAIVTPLSGMVIFDTTLNKLCVRGASAWETINSV